jgi:hypothetical protein
MCQARVSKQYVPMSGCNCGCCGCGCGPPFRAFLTTEEKLERLNNYQDQLEKELAGVREQIGEIKQA